MAALHSAEGLGRITTQQLRAAVLLLAWLLSYSSSDTRRANADEHKAEKCSYASCVFTSALCDVLLIHPAWKACVNFTSNLLPQTVFTHSPNTKKTQFMSNSSLDNSMTLLINDNPHAREQPFKLKEMVFPFSLIDQK